MNRPTIIVISPIRNEAWVLDAFLACTSSWADKIILADQHSTDGSREIALSYPKVTLIENPIPEMNQAAARTLLFREVDKIEGDKIVFALDADEFLSPGFAETRAWRLIIDSKPNSIFCFKWLNLYGDFSHVLPINESQYMEWACHLDSNMSLEDEYRKREQRAVHECRIPCFNEEDCRYILIDDIRFIHLARLNIERTKNKEDFYQVSTIDKSPRFISAVSLYRTYHHNFSVENLLEPIKLLSVSGEDYSYKVRFDDIGQYYIEEIVSILKRRSIKPFKRIDIWTNQNLIQEGFRHNPSMGTRMLFGYLKRTTAKVNSIPTKVIDAVLKRII